MKKQTYIDHLCILTISRIVLNVSVDRDKEIITPYVGCIAQAKLYVLKI